MNSGKKVTINEIYDTTKSGKFKILNISHTKEYDRSIVTWYNIIFLDTEYKTTAHTQSIQKGTVFDKLKVRQYGGFIGIGEYTHTHFLYRRWNCMMNRCYYKFDKDYPKYGARGFKVDKRWHNFQNYVKDSVFIDGYNEERIKSKELELDKDIKILGNKIYSKDTCLWIKSDINNRHHAVHQFPNHVIIDTIENTKYYVDNMKQFCKDNEWIRRDSIKIPRKSKNLYKKRWYILYEKDYNENKEFYDQYLQSQSEEDEINE